MNKKTLAAVIFASLSTTMMSAHATNIDPAAQSIIETAVINESDLNDTLATAITNNPAMAESLVAAAIDAVGANSEAAETIIATTIIALGADSPLIAKILTIATDAGVNSDTVTSVAIASGVDATIASEATAARSTRGNNGNGHGNNGHGRGGGNSGNGGGNVSPN